MISKHRAYRLHGSSTDVEPAAGQRDVRSNFQVGRHTLSPKQTLNFRNLQTNPKLPYTLNKPPTSLNPEENLNFPKPQTHPQRCEALPKPLNREA